MKYYMDTSVIALTVTAEPVAKVDQNKQQKTERDTGRPMWSTQVLVLDEDGGSIVAITTAGEKPDVKRGEQVTAFRLEALPWATNGRNGVAFRAVDIKAVGSPVK